MTAYTSENETDRLAAIQQTGMDDYDYSLPEERIAKYPLPRRDKSKLLLYRDGEASESVFERLPDWLPEKSLIVFNNTRVIHARLLFKKDTGAQIEAFCLEPDEPRDYASSFQSLNQCSWTCLVGNLKRWKDSHILRMDFPDEAHVTLTAELKQTRGNVHDILFRWNHPLYTFEEILNLAGSIPVPPYLNRAAEESDLQSYQTVYSKINGSVAAPTAGLHFTPELLQRLDERGFKREEVTLHVGAGTFKPVKTDTIGGHEMHSEYISVDYSTVERLMEHVGRITAVGTTSVRTLESLYHIGIKLEANPRLPSDNLSVSQWEPYQTPVKYLPAETALQNILNYMDGNAMKTLTASTQIMIAPGYDFRIVNSLITNFHQPRSTLLLLLSAFVNSDWKKIYHYALNHDFRFLSYGDSSLLFRK